MLQIKAKNRKRAKTAMEHKKGRLDGLNKGFMKGEHSGAGEAGQKKRGLKAMEKEERTEKFSAERRPYKGPKEAGGQNRAEKGWSKWGNAGRGRETG